MTPILAVTLVLQMHNLAGAPPAVVNRALSELGRMYDNVGVHLDWDEAANRRIGHNRGGKPQRGGDVRVIARRIGSDLFYAPVREFFFARRRKLDLLRQATGLASTGGD